MGLLASNKVTQRNMALPSLPASGLHLKDLLELCLKTAVIVSYLFHAVICHFSERSVSGWTQGQDPKLCKHGGNSCSGNLLDQVSADTCSTLATGKGLQDSSTECLPPCTAVCNHQHSFLLVRASRYFQSPFLTSLVILLSCPCVCGGGGRLASPQSGVLIKRVLFSWKQHNNKKTRLGAQPCGFQKTVLMKTLG